MSITQDTMILQKINDVICSGDTSAYEFLMTKIPYYDYFVYSIFIANEYNYTPAFYRAYRIYDLWNKLYGCKIESTSWQSLNFWLKWGIQSGCTCCNMILRDSIDVSEETLLTLDSINGFKFLVPQTVDKDSIRIVKEGAPSLYLSISMIEFESLKKKLICQGDGECSWKLGQYVSMEKNGFSPNEYFMFKLCDQIKNKGKKNIVFDLYGDLAHIYQLCKDKKSEPFGNAYFNRLGVAILHAGYYSGDEFSIIPLAMLYAQGIYVKQDTAFAHSLLLQKMSEETSQKWLKRWQNNKY